MVIDAGSGMYRINRFPVGGFFGPVDLGLHMAGSLNSINIGAGLLAGSIFPGSNRLVFTCFSPCWGGFYISTMGGAGLVFDNLGINMVSVVGKSSRPSVLVLNREHGEEVQVRVEPVDLYSAWNRGEGGIYGLIEEVLERYGGEYSNDPRVLAVGPAAEATDMGAVGSAPVQKGKLTNVDTWAGRGGMGTRLLQTHGLAAIIFGGTFIDEDFRDRNVADEWFENRYSKKMAAKDLEATIKYRFDPKFGSGGTFGVNYSTLKGRLLAFNYQDIYWEEQERLDLYQRFVRDHYLEQFNNETIKNKQQRTCGEPCAAVCKKMNGRFKKDYEPYQTMGPLCGIFDQRAAEKLTRHADRYGFDAISVGGVLAWLMECVDRGIIRPEEVGLREKPLFSTSGFQLESDSIHNAEIGIKLLDGIVGKRSLLDLSDGARRAARHLARERGREAMDCFPYTAFGRRGWMVPNQYWTPGVLSPMAIMGKYYMYYGNDFLPPRELGRLNADRFRKELILDNMGICRFHRGWAEEMIPDIVGSLFGKKEEFLESVSLTASRINSRNASVFWEPERNLDYVKTFLERQHTVEGQNDPELIRWMNAFGKDKREAGFEYWYEMHKGITEMLTEFN
jgi:glyceraldehyde-3-phosphate dehydrogenase (ferredoxin)